MASISLKYKSKQGNLTAPGDVDPGAMIPIATLSASGSAVSVEFTNIPLEYEHLQIRGIVRNTWGINAREEISVRFNSDNATNYSWHELSGDGSSASAGGYASQTYIGAGVLGGDSNTSGIYSAAIIDILDYSNTNKFKTLRSLTGLDANGSGWLWYRSGNWRSTSAINTIRVASANGQNLKIYSTFALYGIKRAGA
jgi:hypothetical protein